MDVPDQLKKLFGIRGRSFPNKLTTNSQLLREVLVGMLDPSVEKSQGKM